MKKYLYLSAAALAFAGCSSDEFLGEVTQPQEEILKQEAIAFGSLKTNITRAGDHTGSDAAALLNKNFVVEGVMGNGTSQTEAFDHYNVNYTANTANTTESNTADWEYVGQTKHDLSAASAQTIKYWNYDTKQYDFVAFSYGTADNTKVTLTEIKTANLGNDGVTTGKTEAVYTVTGSAADLAKTYVADLVTLYNRDGVSEYGTTVTPKFRSLGTKVRIAFYETVPGYSVANLKFYSTAWDGESHTTAGADEATLFASSAIFPATNAQGASTSEGTMSVYFPTVGWDKSGKAANSTVDADYNQAHIKFEQASGKELGTTMAFGALANMKNKEGSEATGAKYLGRNSSEATYAGDVTAADHAYQVVLPLGTTDNLQLRVEYDLVPTDGGAGTIHVRDACAVVPAKYADWKPNYAYTYIFKISDNTNGWTGTQPVPNPNYDPADPTKGPEFIEEPVEGLTPITFDAVVVDTEDGIQETITTVATPSITTYQAGKVVTAGSEYKAGNIYTAVMNSDATPVTLTATNCGYYEVTAGASIANETLIQEMLNGTKSNTGITLSPKGATILDAIPGADTADGNDLAVAGKVAKLEVYSGKTYVFNYSDGSKNHVKVIKVQ